MAKILISQDEFITQANKVHNNLFDYSLIKFPITKTQKITIIDPEFGPYIMEAYRHLNGQVCVNRANLKKGLYKRLTLDTFIKRANKKHNNLYDYSKVDYKNSNTKICIIDPEYGDFWQSPAGHLSGQGHPLRGRDKAAKSRRMPLDEFIKQANKKHNNLYDYSKVKYKHCDEKVCIIDPEYGEFWQSPYQHLRSHGCAERTKYKKWLEHVDHIIPLAILFSTNRKYTSWYKDRPLYKLLTSDINLRTVDAKFNRDKSDYVTINEKTINASSVRNNYDVIEYLIRKLLKIDPTEIIAEDKEFIKKYFNL